MIKTAAAIFAAVIATSTTSAINLETQAVEMDESWRNTDPTVLCACQKWSPRPGTMGD